MFVKLVSIFLLFSFILCINIDLGRYDNKAEVKLKEVKKTKWGKIMLNLVEIAKENQSPVQILQESVNQLSEEVEKTLQNLDKQYELKTTNFNKDITKKQRYLDQAQIDVSNTQSLVDDVLLKNREQVERNLFQVEENLKGNHKTQQQETLQRSNQREGFLKIFEENTGAVNMIDQSISILQGMIETGSVSLIERLRAQVRWVHKQIGKNDMYGPIIQSIAQLAEKDFSDKALTRNVLSMFNDLRVDIVNQINKDTGMDHDNQESFEKRMEELNTENALFQKSIIENTYQLSMIIAKLNDLKDYLQQRKDDLTLLQAQLQEVQNMQATYTGVYEKLRQNYLSDQQAAAEASQLINSADFINLKI